MILLILQLSHKLSDDTDVSVVIGVVEADGVDQADELKLIAPRAVLWVQEVASPETRKMPEANIWPEILLHKAHFPVPVFPMMRSVLTRRSLILTSNCFICHPWGWWRVLT